MTTSLIIMDDINEEPTVDAETRNKLRSWCNDNKGIVEYNSLKGREPGLFGNPTCINTSSRPPVGGASFVEPLMNNTGDRLNGRDSELPWSYLTVRD